MNSKKLLLFLTNIPNPYQLDLFDELVKYYDLFVIYYSKIEKNRSWNLNAGSNSYQSVVLNSGPLNFCIQKIAHDLYFQLSLITHLIKFCGDVVVISGSYYSPNTWVAIFILKIKGKKVFWMGDQINPNDSPFKKKLKKIFLKPLFYVLDGILAVGQVAIKSYREYGYKGAITCVLHSINNDRFHRVEKMNSTIVIVMSGSMIYRKGIDIGLQVFKEAMSKVNQSCELRVIGGGPLMSTYKNMCKDYPNIHFLGFKEPTEVDHELVRADIFLCCTRYDSWGVVINEAIGAGVPVIVSDTCGASELIDGDGGFICSIQKIEGFVDALVNLINSAELRQSMARYNWKIRNQYSSRVMANRIFDFIG